ncbi:hypothetical protein FHW58_002499 [Duganella sp. 1224]|uniref:hypothetical protein n=1 Tax=Duganella sp. 1224 TaxID=2587052 RepID=UPI0015CE9DD8|nr:hypothetical protein [Duganella sp. 1224]NYE61292.1 hypothetical protein [Duganella sp. 1224]
MRATRPCRFFVIVFAVFSMLYTQCALASYVCPSTLMPGGAAQSAQMAQMADCTGVDKQQPGLCHAHGHKFQQSLDKPDLPQVAPFLSAGLVRVVLPAAPPSFHAAAAPPAAALAYPTSPPIAIRHCCFRI